MTETEVPPPLSETKPDKFAAWKRWLWLVDLLVFLALTLAAFPVRNTYTKGDLWGDEGDYALASVKSFPQHRWDVSDDPKNPVALIELRHYHPPLLAYTLKMARQYGNNERTLRMPFVLAGCLAVGMTYLCGAAAFRGRREIAVIAALFVLAMPIHVRSSAHAIPWPFIGLFLLILTWTLLKYAETKRVGWLTGTMVTLGIFFVHSEMVYPALVLVALAAPFLFWTDRKDRAVQKRVLLAVSVGTVLALTLVLILWPVGIFGGSFRMLTHYVGVSKEDVPVSIKDVTYRVAPRWAYAYWLWTGYLRYAVLYVIGAVGALLLFVFRKGNREVGIVLLATGVLLAVAHRAHIIGAEYLAHCIPYLGLLAAMALYALSWLWRPLGVVPGVLLAAYVLTWTPAVTITDRDERELLPRWPAAAAYLKANWRDGDKLVIGSQTEDVARWYIRYIAGLNVTDSQVRPLVLTAPGRSMKQQLAEGKIRYVMLSSTFTGEFPLEPELKKILSLWKLVYQAEEGAKRAPRLRIFERPSGG